MMRKPAYLLILGSFFGIVLGEPHIQSRTGSAEAELDSIYPGLGLVKKSKRTIGLTEWEKAKFSPVSKRRIFLKSRYPSGLGRDHFYRFTIDIETYSDTAAARFRLDSLKVMPPKLRPEEDKAFSLRRGIIREKEAIVVCTDVFAYDAKLDQLTQALEASLSEANPKRRKHMLDSLAGILRKPSE